MTFYLYGNCFSVAVVGSFERASPTGVKGIVEAGLEVVKADVRNTDVISGVVGGSDSVVHADAYVSVEESMARPELYRE